MVPALFSAAIHPMIEELQGHLLDLGVLEPSLKAFYLDDGILAGDQEKVAAAIDFLETRFDGVGLSISMGEVRADPDGW